MSFEIKSVGFKDFFDLGYCPSSYFEDREISNYFFEYFEGEDRSQVVFYKNKPVLFFPATLKNEEYSFAGQVIQPHFLTEDIFVRQKAMELVGEALLKENTPKMQVKFSPEVAPLALKMGCAIHSRMFSRLDLEQTEETLRRSLRASYKSLVNKGQREVQTIVDYGPEASWEFMREAQDFHFKTAGRKTRSDRTWEIQHELVLAKKAFHVRSYREGTLVASSYVFTNGVEALYGSGIYNRELMREGHPLSHWNVYRSILFAKELSVKSFILGDVGPDFSDKKNEDIGMFKRGFGGTITLESALKIGKVSP